jgi:hypothetical protein
MTTTDDIGQAIAAMCSDEAGFQILRKPTSSRYFMSYYNGSVASRITKLAVRIQIPKKILNLLNKETQTERLQDLNLVVLVRTPYSGSTVYVECNGYVKYTETAKQITIR